MTTIAAKFNTIQIPEWITSVFMALAAVVFAFLSFTGILPFAGIEAAGFVTGAMSVWWSAKNSVWGFPIGIANNIFYFIVFIDAGFYADMMLQVVYVGFALYGIYKWVWGSNRAPTPIRHINWQIGATFVGFVTIMTLVMHEVLIYFNGTAPFWDAFLTAMSLGAMMLMVLRYFENWFVWITADVFYIWLFWTRDLPLTSVLYVVFMLICFTALYYWTKELREQRRGKKLTVEAELKKV
jgi:nicotinamide mononucleotide transporter